eukprot:GHVO01012764.1.p2 GENE.GHVO01012764.1~~GHVO01012764.1.p2  ORF type:complete len:124 (+),score=17.00 GHVO01012764.1:107-478(+)
MLTIARAIAWIQQKMRNVRQYSALYMTHAQRAWVMGCAVDVMSRAIWYAWQEPRQQQDLVHLRNSKLLKMLTIACSAWRQEKMRNARWQCAPAMTHALRAWVMWGVVDVMIRALLYAWQEPRQ